MLTRDNAEHCVFCGKTIPEGNQVCIICGRGKPKKQTNLDRIRNMSVEEMVQFLMKCGWDFPPYCEYTKATNGCDCKCIKCAREWLESEVDTK